MEDLSKRKRPHTIGCVNKDINENRLDIKRQKSRPQPSEMTDPSTSLRLSNSSETQNTSAGTAAGARSKLTTSLNGTEQIQSKLGKLHLNQAPEATKRLHFGECSSSPCNPRRNGVKRSKRMENFDEMTSPSGDRDGGNSCQYHVDVGTSSTSTEGRSDSSIDVENLPSSSSAHFCQSDVFGENNWLSSDSSQSGMHDSTFTQSKNIDVSRITLPYDDNQNNIVLPSTSNGINNLNPSVENIDSLFSVSPDMRELLNYSGLPLMPIFARRNDGNLPAPAPSVGGSSSWDDEGFDEPSESNGSGTHQVANMSSDVEEDFAL